MTSRSGEGRQPRQESARAVGPVLEDWVFLFFGGSVNLAVLVILGAETSLPVFGTPFSSFVSKCRLAAKYPIGMEILDSCEWTGSGEEGKSPNKK